MNVLPHLVALGVLVVVTGIFLIYRFKLTAWEDDSIHVHEGEDSVVEEQKKLAQKMARADVIAKVLVTLVLVYGIGLAAVYAYLQLPQ